MLDQALDHGRRGEHRDAAMDLQQLEDFRRIEAARGGHHVEPGAGNVGQDVEAGAVGHRRRVDDGIAGFDAVQVGQVVEDRRHHVALGQRHALGAPRGAARIEQPARVLGRARHDFHRLRCEQPLVVAGLDVDHRLKSFEPKRGDRGVEVSRGEAEARAAVGEDELQFLRMQLGIDRHRDQARVPAGEQQFEILRAVLHDQADAVVRLQPCRQAAGELRHALCQSGIGGQDAVAEGQGGSLWMDSRGTQEEVGDIHGRVRIRGGLAMSAAGLVPGASARSR